MKKYIFLVFALVILIIGACKRDALNSTFVGPPALVEFTTVSGLNTTTVDFSGNSSFADSLFYKGTFNQPTYWTIKIKGLTSGAVKIFSGYGTIISAQNTTWDGTSDSLYFFRSGEVCSFSLTVSGQKDPIIGNVYVLNARYFPPAYYFIIDDFNNNVDITSNPIDSSAYGGFVYTGDTNILSRNPTTYDLISSLSIYNSAIALKPIEGNGIGVLSGDLTKIKGKYLVGGFYLPSVIAGVFHGLNPDSVYLNVIARSEGAPYGNKLTLQVSEQDPFIVDQTIPFSTGDVWAFDTPVLTTDWQIYSVQYSKLSIGYHCNGNFIREPQNLLQANINVVTSVAGGKAKCYVDFYVITYGKPFHP